MDQVKIGNEDCFESPEQVQLEQGRNDLESDDGDKRNICQVYNGRKVQQAINQASEHAHKRMFCSVHSF